MIIKPQSLSELVGLKTNHDKIGEFLNDFQSKTIGFKKACLLHGHQGTGKTTSVHCIAHDYYFPLVEINGSETRTKDALINALSSIISTVPMEYQQDHTTLHRIILIDEADGLDKEAIKILPEIFKRTLHPIFLTANDEYPFRFIKNQMVEVKFYRHKPNTISSILRRYTNNEEHISKIVDCCDGDIRAALNMLDSCVTKMYTEQGIHFVVDSLLNGKPVDGNFDIDNQMLLEWLEENVQYRNLGISFLQDYQNLCNASRLIHKLSNTTHMLLVENTQLLSMFHINEWIKVMSPSYKEKIRVFNAKHEIIKNLSEKLPLHTHKQFESDILPILNRLSKDENWLKDIYHTYLYDNDGDNNPKAEVENMIAMLLNVPKDDIAVKGFFDSVKDKKVKKAQIQEHPQSKTTITNTTMNVEML